MKLLTDTDYIHALIAEGEHQQQDFKFEEDKNFLGKQPARTYVGMTYKGGFSDHLPVFVDLWY